MKIRIAILTLMLCSLGALNLKAEKFHYVGGDISLLPEYESAGAIYKDETGKNITDLLTFCYDAGMNAMRVRLFVNPDDYNQKDKDPNACQDLEYILPLCKRIKDDGFSLMLDFHYSDTWADPVAQWTPKIWEGLTPTQISEELYKYTKETLETMVEYGATPDFIQTGNEISYGMLWGKYGTSNPLKVYYDSDTNWRYFTNYLKMAISACREICPDAKIVLHSERVAQPKVLQGFYERIASYDIDYDIIGLSYYPYFHGTMSVLDLALTTLENSFPDKDIMIVETGYSYKWEVPGTNKEVDYPYTEAGQNQFAEELVSVLERHENCTGLFWWWMEYNAYGTKLSGWYNAPLFNSQTGRATPALKTICKFGSGHGNNGVAGITDDVPTSNQWYDLQGRELNGKPTSPGLYINDRKVKIIR